MLPWNKALPASIPVSQEDIQESLFPLLAKILSDQFQVKWEFYSSILWTLLGSADWDEYTLQTTPLFLMKVNRYDLFLLKLNNWLTGAAEDDICFFVKPAEWSPLLTRICLSGSFGLLRLHSLSCQPQTSMEKA